MASVSNKTKNSHEAITAKMHCSKKTFIHFLLFAMPLFVNLSITVFIFPSSFHPTKPNIRLPDACKTHSHVRHFLLGILWIWVFLICNSWKGIWGWTSYAYGTPAFEDRFHDVVTAQRLRRPLGCWRIGLLMCQETWSSPEAPRHWLLHPHGYPFLIG